MGNVGMCNISRCTRCNADPAVCIIHCARGGEAVAGCGYAETLDFPNRSKDNHYPHIGESAAPAGAPDDGRQRRKERSPFSPRNPVTKVLASSCPVGCILNGRDMLIGSGDVAGGVAGGNANSYVSTVFADESGNADYEDIYASGHFGLEAEELHELGRMHLQAGGSVGSQEERQHTFRSGATFRGQWLGGGDFDGFGVMDWPDGAQYAGQWRLSSAHGLGRFQHSHGDFYVGSWRDNVAHGGGVYVHRNGTKYEGQFVDDLPGGFGIESLPDTSRFIGQFVQGRKSGYGQYEWTDGASYGGSWHEDHISGPGSYKTADGRRFAGSWLASQMHGCGHYEWPDGRRYAGEYEEDQKSGFGTFTWSDGRRYEGFWRQGRQHGLGRLSSGVGEWRVAEWEAGTRTRWLDNAVS